MRRQKPSGQSLLHRVKHVANRRLKQLGKEDISVTGQHIAQRSGERSASDPLAGLTLREMQILRLLQQGLSNKMISRNLGIELPTVKNHVRNVLSKLGIHRRVEAMSFLHRQEQAVNGSAKQTTTK